MLDVDAAHAEDERHLALREIICKLISGDAVFVQAARFGFGLEHHHLVAEQRETHERRPDRRGRLPPTATLSGLWQARAGTVACRAA